LVGIGGGGEHGMVAGGMEAKNHLGLGWFFEAQALRADRHATVAADLDDRAHAPHVIPPGATGCGPQDGAFFFFGLIPGSLRGLAQFAMDFMGVAMRPERGDLRIGRCDFGNLFTGEVGGEAALPELMFAFDFAFGLGRWGIPETDVIKLECPAQLGQGVRIVGEKETVVIDVDLEWATVGQESGGEKIEVGEQQFAFVDLRAGEQAAAIVQHVEHGEGKLGVRKPAVRRGVELPEFTDLRALPAAHRGQDFLGRDGMGELVCQRPAADLSAVEFEGVQAEGFGSGEAVRTRGRAGQPFFEQVQDGLRPSGGVIAPGSARRPEGWLFASTRGVVSGGDRVEPAAGEAELAGGLGDTHRVLPESFEHMADERGSVAMDELLILFKDRE